MKKTKKTKDSDLLNLPERACPSIFRIPAVQEGCEPLVMMRYTNQVVLGLTRKRGRHYLIDGFGISTPVGDTPREVREEVHRWLSIVAVDQKEVYYRLAGVCLLHLTSPRHA